MTAATAVDTDILDQLDFDADMPCEVTVDDHDQCGQPAAWHVTLTCTCCGTTADWLFCAPHHAFLRPLVLERQFNGHDIRLAREVRIS